MSPGVPSLPSQVLDFCMSSISGVSTRADANLVGTVPAEVECQTVEACKKKRAMLVSGFKCTLCSSAARFSSALRTSFISKLQMQVANHRLNYLEPHVTGHTDAGTRFWAREHAKLNHFKQSCLEQSCLEHAAIFILREGTKPEGTHSDRAQSNLGSETAPGAMELTRIPSGPSSLARALPRDTREALVTPYRLMGGSGE